MSILESWRGRSSCIVGTCDKARGWCISVQSKQPHLRQPVEAPPKHPTSTSIYSRCPHIHFSLCCASAVPRPRLRPVFLVSCRSARALKAVPTGRQTFSRKPTHRAVERRNPSYWSLKSSQRRARECRRRRCLKLPCYRTTL